MKIIYLVFNWLLFLISPGYWVEFSYDLYKCARGDFDLDITEIYLWLIDPDEFIWQK